MTEKRLWDLVDIVNHALGRGTSSTECLDGQDLPANAACKRPGDGVLKNPLMSMSYFFPSLESCCPATPTPALHSILGESFPFQRPRCSLQLPSRLARVGKVTQVLN